VGDPSGHPVETGPRYQIEADAPAPCGYPDYLHSSIASTLLQQQRVDGLIAVENSQHRMEADCPELVNHR